MILGRVLFPSELFPVEFTDTIMNLLDPVLAREGHIFIHARLKASHFLNIAPAHRIILASLRCVRGGNFF